MISASHVRQKVNDRAAGRGGILAYRVVAMETMRAAETTAWQTEMPYGVK